MAMRPARQQATRRSILQSGLSSAAALVLSGLTGAAGPDSDAARFQPYDRVEPEAYPWGWIRWLMNGKIDPKAEMTLGLVHIEPNQLNTLHQHPNSAEYLHVISGSLEHLVNDRWVALKPGDTVRIPKGVPHQARSGSQPCLTLVVYDTPTRVMVPVKGSGPGSGVPE